MQFDHLARRVTLHLVFVGAAALPARGFDPPVDKVGPLTLRLDGPSELTQVDKPVPMKVVVENSGAAALNGTLRFAGIDGWRVAPAGPLAFELPARESRHWEITVTASARTYEALYPVHAWADFEADGRRHSAHAVLVVAARPASPPRPGLPSMDWGPWQISSDGELALRRLPLRRALFEVFDQKPQLMPAGWQGSDPSTRATFDFDAVAGEGGDARRAIGIHPPWFEGRTGTGMVEYPLRLPAGVPIRLRFAVAIRQHNAAQGEPPSDGVTFRVHVVPFASGSTPVVGKVVYEKHTDAKTWLPGEADLSGFAGQDVLIRLESHPGPRKDTTCDQSYWAEPILATGNHAAGRMAAPPFPPKADSAATNLGMLEGAGGKWAVRVWPGRRGLLDAAVGFEQGDRRLFFRGFQARVNGDELSEAAAVCSLVKTTHEPAPAGHKVRHSFSHPWGGFDLLIHLWTEGPALRARAWIENQPAPQPWRVVYLENLAAGPWSEQAPRIYAGHGNVIDRPEAFSLGFDGHRLSTSFVGFDFAGGVSLVQAVNAVPSHLEVNPARNHYSLHTPHAQTLSFIPATSAWQGARIWHDVNGLKAGGGADRLAGRFVFDWWGGDYAGNARALERSFRYGMTHSLVLWHNWQRHGYDNRLPDIYPPNPAYGTLQQFQELVKTCKQHGVLFAPHDNYIDYYPDAEGYSYEHIAFTPGGEPVKAWFNPGPKAQSYRWRADRVRPVLERNLKLIRDGFAPDAFFIDVWSSIEPYDYWTHDGQFFDRARTNQTWRELFSWIREYLGEQAPQVSESGHDAQIGDLDGAQANHLRVGDPPAGYYSWSVWPIRCADAERIPWFDAAHHDRFVLHGAGYEERYMAGLDRNAHGMYSDDYICTEVLTGHPAMVKHPFSREAVRKYWLLADLMQALALKRIETVEFAGGNIHRQHVTWEGGGQVWVNRGKDDWQIEGHLLPPFGFHARVPGRSGPVEAAIERKDGQVIEWSFAPTHRYLNARTAPATAAIPGVGPIRTNGACRLHRDGDAVVVMLLPDSPDQTVQIAWPAAFGGMAVPGRAIAITEGGQTGPATPVRKEADTVTLQAPPGTFTLRLTAE